MDYENHPIYTTSFASVYPHYIGKVKKTGLSEKSVDEIIKWLTGYSSDQLTKTIDNKTTFEDFFSNTPKLNPLRHNISGSICGIKIQEIEHPLMKEIRYLDKLIDDLAKGKSVEMIISKLSKH